MNDHGFDSKMMTEIVNGGFDFLFLVQYFAKDLEDILPLPEGYNF